MRNWIPAFLLFCAASLCCAQTSNGYVTGKGVALRALPASYYERLAILPEGTPLEILAVQGKGEDGWVQVRLPVAVTGWVRGESLDGQGVVIQTPCPIHTGPGENFTAFHMAQQGETLRREGRQDGDWVCVQAPPQATAWISQDFVARGAPPAPAVQVSVPAVDVAPVSVEGNDSQRLEALRQQADALQSQVSAKSRE